jgi:predicted porin
MPAKTLYAALLALMGHACQANAADDAAVQPYGRLNLGLESVRQQGGASADDARRTRESNYRSVFGVRGSEGLGGGLHFIFQVEGTLSPDTGAGMVAARDTRAGLEGRWGTLFDGNWTTPYNSATAGFDPFYPTTAGYMSIMGNGSAPTTDNVIDKTSFDRRQQNSVHYWTPAWHGLQLRLAQGLNEESPPNGARPALTSGALVLENGGLYATAAWERHRDYQGPGLDDTGRKLGVAWQLGATRIGAVVEKLRYEPVGGRLERTAYYLSLTHQIGPHGLRLGVARARDGEGNPAVRLGYLKAGPGTGALHATLGYDYALSKRTSLFAFYSRLHNDSHGVYDFAINGLGATAGATLDAAVLGIRHAY